MRVDLLRKQVDSLFQGGIYTQFSEIRLDDLIFFFFKIHSSSSSQGSFKKSFSL